MNLVFQSPLAKAQRHFDVSATERTLAFGAQLAEIGGLEFINVEKAIRLYHDLLGAPSEILFSEAEVKKHKRERAKAEALAAQQQQQILQAQMLQAGAATAKDAAQADQLSAQAQAGPGGMM